MPLFSMTQVLARWRQRLQRLRDVIAAQPSQIDWFARAEERVLTFLIARYGEERAARREEALMDLAPPTLNAALFELEPVEVRPRSRERLSSMLRSVHQLNVDAWRARRWRWFI
jgi:hypothetical protein